MMAAEVLGAAAAATAGGTAAATATAVKGLLSKAAVNNLISPAKILVTTLWTPIAAV
jgi:hypothetical protein